MAEVHDCIAGSLANGTRGYLVVAAIHSVLDCQRDSRTRCAFNGSVLTAPDGMPLVWIGRLMRGSQVDRVYGADLLASVCTLPRFASFRHFFLGGTPESNAGLVRRMQNTNPELVVAGRASPELSLDPDDPGTAAAVEQINYAAPDIVWVALGSGKQERWIANNRDRIKAPVIIGVGAAFDFISGQKRQAPHWMRRVGLEWMFRLLAEPGRLWRRYLEYPYFFFLLVLQVLSLKEFPMNDPPEGDRP